METNLIEPLSELKDPTTGEKCNAMLVVVDRFSNFVILIQTRKNIRSKYGGLNDETCVRLHRVSTVNSCDQLFRRVQQKGKETLKGGGVYAIQISISISQSIERWNRNGGVHITQMFITHLSIPTEGEWAARYIHQFLWSILPIGPTERGSNPEGG